MDLLFILNAFDDNGKGERFGHIDDGFDDSNALLIAIVVEIEEHGIELDDVDVQIAQPVKR